MIVTDDNMAANMYRVGDYVYFETSSSLPYQIRRIEELNKTSNGNVEAKVMCFYRRRDLPIPLITLADRHQMNSATADDTPISAKLKKILIKSPLSVALTQARSASPEGDTGGGGAGGGTLVPTPAPGPAIDHDPSPDDNQETREKESGLSWKQRHQLKHRELFLSRTVETLPATHIRGKCSVTLLNETEAFLSYLNKDDTFFYCLVFDPVQKTLLADKGEIRVGSRYQADATPLLKEGETDGRTSEDLESLVWTPNHNLTDRQIDQFLVISRSVGTFARALDCSSSVKQPSLHMSAAAASRDVTLFHAMDTLDKHRYNMSEAISRLVPSSGPVLCRDEMEEWSASEANLFEEALEKYGKDFNDIKQDFLPWKTLKNIVEYYYMWKTTDRYVQQKRVKAVEAESKLKQVYIPNYNKPNPAVINNSKGVLNGTVGDDAAAGPSVCESCEASTSGSGQWYHWGPSYKPCKLCSACWAYWKKYGGLKNPSDTWDFESEQRKKSVQGSEEERGGGGGSMGSHRPHMCNVARCGKLFKLKAHLAKHYATAHGMMMRSGSPRPIMKTRTAFYLNTSPLTRLARRLCKHLLHARHAARSPFWPVNFQALKQECQLHTTSKTVQELKELLKVRKKERGSVTGIANKLGDPEQVPEWLLPTDKDLIPKTPVIMFPKPPKAPDGSLLYERVPNKPEAEKAALNRISPSLKRRAYDENGLEGIVVPQPGPPSKRPSKEVAAALRAAEGARELLQAPPVAVVPPAGVPVGVPTLPPTLTRNVTHLNGQGRPKIATMTRTGTGRKGVISWMDAPDDVYFRSTPASKKMRRQLSPQELRRASRKPWRGVTCKALGLDLAAPVALAPLTTLAPPPTVAVVVE